MYRCCNVPSCFGSDHIFNMIVASHWTPNSTKSTIENCLKMCQQLMLWGVCGCRIVSFIDMYLKWWQFGRLEPLVFNMLMTGNTAWMQRFEVFYILSFGELASIPWTKELDCWVDMNDWHHVWTWQYWWKSNLRPLGWQQMKQYLPTLLWETKGLLYNGQNMKIAASHVAWTFSLVCYKTTKSLTQCWNYR